MRIVSLISSATEILCELGLRDQLVGISHECDFPSSISTLPRLSKTRLNPTQPSQAIHEEVQERVRKGLSLYEIDSAKLAALKPDLVITQDQCDVCAVSLKDVEEAVCQWTGQSTRLLSLRPYTLKEVEESFLQVGAVTDRIEEAHALQDRFRAKLEAIRGAVSRATSWPRVLNLEWLEPPIVGGGWIPELVRIAGGVPLIVGDAGHFLKVGWNEIESINPEVIALYPCGFDLTRTLEEMKEPAILAQLSRLDAVRESNMFVCDGNAYFNRSGPRLADSCELLAGLFHPGICAEYRKKHSAFFKAWSIG